MNDNSNDNSNDNTPEPGSPRSRSLLTLAGLALACGLAGSSCTFVDESEWVLVERLGRVVRLLDQPQDRGLNWKLPWPIETTRTFDARVHFYDPPGGEMVTADKKNITVDAYLCWRIASTNTAAPTAAPPARPLYRFFTTLGTTQSAHVRLSEHVLPALRTRLGETDFDQLVSVNGSESGPDSARPGQLVSIPQSVRAELADLLRQRYGIELIDVRIKRLNFPQQNQVAVYERMKTERKKIAEQYRSEGLAENTRIRSQADLQYSQILANARRDAELIRGRWSIKRMHRLILCSATYRMQSTPRADAMAVDPENRLWWRSPLRRLEAEALRDAMLAVAGELDPQMNGSLLHVANREFIFNHTSKDETSYDSRRRSVYLPVIRNHLYDVFSIVEVIVSALFQIEVGVVVSFRHGLPHAYNNSVSIANNNLLQCESPTPTGKSWVRYPELQHGKSNS